MRLLRLLALVPLALAIEVRQHLQTGSCPQTFVNTAVARIVELGGSTVAVKTQFNVKALIDDPEVYVLALGGENNEVPAWLEVQVDSKPVENVVIDSLGGAPVALVPVGKLNKDDTVTISLSTVSAHATRPLPPAIAQNDPQYVVWETDSYLVDSAYPSEVERVKVRSPTPQILSNGKVPSTYTRDSDIVKSAATLTLGPFYSVPVTVGSDAAAKRQSFYVHYETREPIVGIRSLHRAAEVSHWGANLNIQDEIALFNDGPQLKGQFSRLAQQQSRFHSTQAAQVINRVALRLPSSAHSVYYYDTIGNVSTSNFRSGQANSARRGRVIDSLLELRPRYPILGGWNYSFTVGWDSPLSEVLKVEPDGKQVLAVPFATSLSGVVTDELELRVVLPDGASDVNVYTPFPVDSIEHSIHKTYLDTTGRPVVTITKSAVTEHHAQNIYVTYSYPLSAQLQKPLLVSSVVGSLLLAFLVLRRVDYSIDKKTK